nr:MAG TPA: hypothetical protein [Caudoviricetes sp.]
MVGSPNVHLPVFCNNHSLDSLLGVSWPLFTLNCQGILSIVEISRLLSI